VRLLAIGLAVAVIVFALTAGHVLFLPLLFLPLDCSRSGIADDGSRARLLAATRVGRGDVVVSARSVSPLRASLARFRCKSLLAA
jgi:hypothetical protein